MLAGRRLATLVAASFLLAIPLAAAQTSNTPPPDTDPIDPNDAPAGPATGQNTTGGGTDQPPGAGNGTADGNVTDDAGNVTTPMPPTQNEPQGGNDAGLDTPNTEEGAAGVGGLDFGQTVLATVGALIVVGFVAFAYTRRSYRP